MRDNEIRLTVALTEGAVDGRDLIGWAYRYDGPHFGENCAQASAAVAEAVRYLCNATRQQHALQWPSHVEQVVSGISSAAAMLPQLFDQLAGWLERAADDEQLYDTHDEADIDLASLTAHTAAESLRQASSACRVLQRDLTDIGLSSLGSRATGHGGEQR
jgi:hypothetical protein